MTIELSEPFVSSALEKLSWQALEDHLKGIMLAPPDVDKLVGLVQRSEALVLKRHDQKKQKNRDKLLDKLAGYLDAKGFPNQAELVGSHSARLNQIDSIYCSILELLSNSDAANLSPELRVSALIERSNIEYGLIVKQMNEEIIATGELDLGKVTMQGSSGNEFHPGGVHEALLTTIANTLGMEAHINRWYDDQGFLVLPALPVPSNQDQITVGSVQMLAVAWGHWQFSERRHRYLGAPLTRIAELDPAWAEFGIKGLWDSRPADDDVELYSQAANMRLMERFKQHLAPVLTNPHYKKLVYGTEGKVKLFPNQAVSLLEIHAAECLSQLLSVDLKHDQSEYAGLTFSEWIRGYSVLQNISDSAMETGDADRLTMRFSESQLVEMLQRLGLQGNKAHSFISHATYRKASRDLFDQPLLKLKDGSYLLLAIAAAASSIPKIILSTLGMLEVNLDARGKRFEKSMIDLLNQNGIKAKTITCTRDNETYDYDVAFVWGEYLFLFECKSRNLPTGDPARTYFFSLGIRKVVKQVNRLAEGLNKHPDILSVHMPEAVGKRIVHCVVNSLPFAKFTEENNLHFADEGGISRFFKQSEIGPRKLTQTGLSDIDPASVIAHLWDGDKPTPEDFLRHLRSPIQLAHPIHHMSINPIHIPVGKDEALQLFEFQQTDKSNDSLREASKRAGYRTGGDLVP
ncbi:hypothetical protein GY15_22850 [Delftia sp. 670]|jgi:hypothetical protein|uniref:hypothetical protein n=1 Tax=Delftia lacustris TaxID=558537 RepID=UPI0004D6B07E|nr:hypothetical protein [Delftia lacustris]KEH12148.1 hypothetical protein GY15_22850 [Delftia sp. 670]BDE71629.1 hypothetical protein HQS1_27530 [Delftia lacustris]